MCKYNTNKHFNEVKLNIVEPMYKSTLDAVAIVIKIYNNFIGMFIDYILLYVYTLI